MSKLENQFKKMVLLNSEQKTDYTYVNAAGTAKIHKTPKGFFRYFSVFVKRAVDNPEKYPVSKELVEFVVVNKEYFKQSEKYYSEIIYQKFVDLKINAMNFEQYKQIYGNTVKLPDVSIIVDEEGKEVEAEAQAEAEATPQEQAEDSNGEPIDKIPAQTTNGMEQKILAENDHYLNVQYLKNLSETPAGQLINEDRLEYLYDLADDDKDTQRIDNIAVYIARNQLDLVNNVINEETFADNINDIGVIEVQSESSEAESVASSADEPKVISPAPSPVIYSDPEVESQMGSQVSQLDFGSQASQLDFDSASGVAGSEIAASMAAANAAEAVDVVSQMDDTVVNTSAESTNEVVATDVNVVELPKSLKAKYWPYQANVFFGNDEGPEWDLTLMNRVLKSGLKKEEIIDTMDSIIADVGKAIYVSKRKSDTIEELHELTQLQFCIKRNLSTGPRGKEARVPIKSLVNFYSTLQGQNNKPVDNAFIEANTMNGQNFSQQQNVPSTQNVLNQRMYVPDSKKIQHLQNISMTDLYGKSLYHAGLQRSLHNEKSSKPLQAFNPRNILDFNNDDLRGVNSRNPLNITPSTIDQRLKDDYDPFAKLLSKRRTFEF